MKLKDSSSVQKLKGAYYTPQILADSIVNLFINDQIDTILEPSCGDGVFLTSLKKTGFLDKLMHLDAIEIDSAEASKVAQKFKEFDAVEVSNEDFFKYYKESFDNKKYDLVLGNPPYIRYQYLTQTQRSLQAKILTSHGMKSNKLINAWVAFMVACVQLLSDKGKIAFIVPAEILQVAYAEDLRLYLAEHLGKITLITFNQLVFPDIEQEVVVFIGEKSDTEKGIRIVELNNLSDFSTLDLSSNGFQKLSHVKEKWTKYFITPDEMRLIKQLQSDDRFAKFSDYGIINVGVTTGNNKYFSVTEEVSNLYDLQQVTLPLIGRSSHAHGIYFTDDDWKANRNAGKPARLICFPDISLEKYPPKHKEYILRGESNGENLGYKCSIRDKWYIVPSVWIPDAFFLRRNNLYPKFVLNCCGAVSTDTMHRMKFNADVEPDDLLLAYYNSISFAFTELCGRSYGGGVLEILPGEMGKIVIPKISNISTLDRSLKQDLLKRIDKIVRSGNDIQEALDLVDQVVLINLLGISKDTCRAARMIWKKMQNRRLARA